MSLGKTPSDLAPSQLANAIRALSMDAVEKANSGHPGMPMGAADVALALFKDHLKFDAGAPDWPDRDRFVLSAGHGSMLIYALAYLLGYEGMPLEEIKNFRQFGGSTAGHPEFGHAPAVETTTGPLGQGLANAVGMAMAEAHLNARYGDDLVDHNTYALVGDGCLMEGISQEAIALAGHLKLSKLIVLFDDNNISIDGPLSLSDSTNQLTRFAASGWDTVRVDGHDVEAVSKAIAKAKKSDRPSFIACKTTIGYGAPTKAGKAAAHGAPLGGDEITGAREALQWTHEPFVVPDEILKAWRAIGVQGKDAREAWAARLASSPKAKAFSAAQEGDYEAAVSKAVSAHKKALADEPQKVATRKASMMAIEAIFDAVPDFFGGSADLTGSNLTKTKAHDVFSADNYAGRYIHYGIREHGMAAAMNGMAVHGGVVPYGGTFLVFTDYCRPSIRLSALMQQRVIYVMTHDSIGLGEDGPTHQPVEHLAALRAIPNLLVLRPCDVVETAECWEIAVNHRTGPSVLALSRQGLAQQRTDFDETNVSARGAYVLREKDDAKVTLIASGAEVEAAINAGQVLAETGVSARIVSAPSFELFSQQDTAYQRSVLGNVPRIGVEAAVQQGWDLFLRPEDRFIGMKTFGASAPASALFEHFGITASAIADEARQLIG
ncbi:MAG: transketolase [Pseudomonadota bacterium]